MALFVQAAGREWREPTIVVECATPEFVEDAQTLILNDIHALDASGQHRLTEWLNERRQQHTQIVSLTSLPVFAFVAKSFDANLFYRLNTIHLTVQPSPPMGHATLPIREHL